MVTVQFRGFSSTTTYPPDYLGPTSQLRVSIHPPSNHEAISVFRGVNPQSNEGGANHQFCAIAQNLTTGAFYGFVPSDTSATSGQLRLSAVNGVVTAFYNETLNPTTGWHQLATFTPPMGIGLPYTGHGRHGFSQWNYHLRG